MTHMISMANSMAISLEILREDNGCSFEKEFTKLIRMNPYTVLYLIFKEVDSCHYCVYGPLT